MKEISISGGVIGGIIGAICAGPLGVVLGVGLGLFFVKFSDDADTKHLMNDEEEEKSEAPVSARGVRLFFQCLGKLAKSDGRVSEDEAAFVRSIMQAWELDKNARRQMGAEFNKGRDSSASFLHLITHLAEELSRTHTPYSARCVIIQAFCALAMADHELHPDERRMLEEAGRVLEAEECVHEFFADDDSEKDEDEDASYSPPPEDSLQHCYDILGISSTATDAEVKSAYRQMAKKFHPDFAEGAGLSAAAIQRAKEKFQELGTAYDTIRQSRGMK